MTEDRNDELEDRSIEFTQSKQTESRLKIYRASEFCETITKDVTFI